MKTVSGMYHCACFVLSRNMETKRRYVLGCPDERNIEEELGKEMRGLRAEEWAVIRFFTHAAFYLSATCSRHLVGCANKRNPHMRVTSHFNPTNSREIYTAEVVAV
jgi:hypothetical protein